MNISTVSKITGLSARMIRFYEANGISNMPRRGTSGYREFGADDIANLRFIRNARDMGFELTEIRKLLEFWRQGTETAGQVLAVVRPRLTKLRNAESRIKSSRVLLESLLQSERTGPRSECELLDYLAAQSTSLQGHSPE